MKLSKIKLLVVLLTCSLFLFGLSAGCSCNDNENKQDKADLGVLNGFDIPEHSNYFYGDCIDVLDPIVIDGIGNVLDVTATVKTSSGEKLETEYGKFFAEDLKGYTVTYKIVGLDNKEHTKETKINVVKAVKDVEVKLLDVGDENSFELSNLLPDEQKAVLSEFASEISYSFARANSTEKISLNGTTVDFTKVPKAYYSFKAELPIGSENEYQPIYSCEVDFYNSNEKMVWQDNDSLFLSDLICKDCESATKMVKSVASGNDLPNGAQAAEYYYVTIPTSQLYDVYAFSFMGMHSKAYYEKYYNQAKAQGFSYTIEYDCYQWTTNPTYKTEDGETAIFTATEFTMYGEHNVLVDMKSWKTFSVSLETILDKWDICSSSAVSSENDSVYSNNVEFYHHDFYGYWGNFRTVTAVDSAESTDTLLVDKTKNNFSYNQLLDEETSKKFEKYKESGTIVWTLNGKEVTDFTSLYGLYQATAVLKLANNEEITIYKAQVDFYDSTETSPVWIKELSLDNLVLKSGDMSGELATENLPGGATESTYYHVTIPTTTAQTSAYVFSVKAVHCKKYYQKWLNKGNYALQFTFIHTSEGVKNEGYSASQFYINGNSDNYTMSEWYTVTIPFETLLNDFDVYGDIDNNWGDGSSDGANMVYSADAQYYGYDIDGYFGGFRLVEVTE